VTSVVGFLHDHLVFSRRTHVLADHLARILPTGSVLDVGCGDGVIDRLITNTRASVAISGVDVMMRPSAQIDVRQFDGLSLPFHDGSFDAVMFVDVLHHTIDPTILLREARRVARKSVVIKDHTMDGVLAYHRLRLMDWVGNAHHGVALPYNYWGEKRWRECFCALGLTIEEWVSQVDLYPVPFRYVFDRQLHFIARLGLAATN
jgi:SAM-dependent methyltransferase